MIMIPPMCTNAISRFPIAYPQYVMHWGECAWQHTSHFRSWYISYVDAGLGEIFRANLVLNDACGKLQIRRFLWMPVSLLYFFILISQSLDIQSPLPQVKASQDIDSKTSHWSCDRFKPTWFIHSLFHLKRGIPTGWKEFHHAISQQNISRR